MNLRPFLFATLVATTAFAAPDEVKLKSGKEYKNLKKEGESASEYKFVDLDGKKVVIPKANVESYVEKPTVREELEHKKSLIAKPDAKQFVQLAKWAGEQDGLLKKEAEALYREALALDENDEAARTALGYVKKDGKWHSAEEAAAEAAKLYEERAKLAGAKQVKGAWMLPADVAKKELKLVEHEGHWVTAARKKEIDEKGLVFAEGDWITAEEKEKFDQGMRKTGKGAWKPTEDLDGEHTKWQTAWSIKGRWFEIRTNAAHARGRFALKWADGTADQMVRFSGVEPAVYGKEGLLLLAFGAKVDDYKQAGAGVNNDWSALRSSSGGCFYAPQSPWEKTRGAGITYDCQAKTGSHMVDDYEYGRYFVRRVAAETFIGRFTDLTKVDARLLDAWTAYFSGFNFIRNKYAPHWWPYGMWMNNIGAKNASDALTGVKRDAKDSDPSIWQAGLFLHYLTTKNEEAVRKNFLVFLSGKGTIDALMKDVFGDQAKDAVNAEYDEWLKAYRKSFKETEIRKD